MTQPADDTLTAARAWRAAGFSVVPVATDGSKRPAIGWKQYQTTAATDEDLADWFTPRPGVLTPGIGVITGAVSGQLEMFELEGRAVAEGLLAALRAAMEAHGQAELWATVAGGRIETSPSGGLHLYYRVTDGEARRNTKLARRPSTDAELADNPAEKLRVLIETRGEGGFTVVAPTPGYCHPTGRPWAAIIGAPASIPTITAEQRDTLHAIATLLDRMPAKDVAGTYEPADPATPGYRRGTRPGDDYNDKTGWAELLTPLGWTRMWRLGDGWGWRRPGKKDHSISATTGTSSDGVDRLYVFSTSTDLPTETPISKFAFYALTRHGGDYAAAAKDLAGKGFGAPRDAERPPVVVQMRPRSVAPAPVPAGTATGTGTDGGRVAVVMPLPMHTAPATLTDRGNALLLIKRHQHRLRYIPSAKTWASWTDTEWLRCDDDGIGIQAAIETIEAIQPGGDETIMKHQQRSLSRRQIESMTVLASKDPRMRIDINELDADPYILNTPGCVVDLRGGQTRPNRPEDYCTKLTRVKYDPEAECPRFLRFLHDTFGGDPEIVGYLQRLVGYSASGVTRYHLLPFLHGSGANGKTVFMEVTTGVLGDYATTAPQNFLMAGGRNDESAIARLKGMRMVVASEVSQRAQFDETKVKLLTGGDKLTARFLYGQYFTFVPSHTLWLMGNHQPRVEAGGDSFWRRLRLIPFSRQVPADMRIEGLADQILEAESAGVLRWIVDGAIDVFTNGLREPGRVMAATAQYADEEDALARFVTDLCTTGRPTDYRADTKRTREVYERWCRAEGEQALTPQMFGRELRTRFGVQGGKSNGRRMYFGLGLRADETGPDAKDDDPRSTPWEQR